MHCKIGCWVGVGFGVVALMFELDPMVKKVIMLVRVDRWFNNSC